MSSTMREVDATREYRQNIKAAEERNALAHPVVVARIAALDAEVERLTAEISRLRAIVPDYAMYPDPPAEETP